MNPGKQQSSKQRGQDLGWKVRDRAYLLLFTYTLCIVTLLQCFSWLVA